MLIVCPENCAWNIMQPYWHSTVTYNNGHERVINFIGVVKNN
jgi:hypothetical protein